MEDVEGISLHVPEEKAPHIVNAEVIRLQHPEDLVPRQLAKKGFQEEPNTLNVLVNDGSRVDAYTLDLYAPPNLIRR